MKKLIIIAAAVGMGIVLLAGIIYFIPAPFKPSFWQDQMKRTTQSQLDKSTDPVYLPRTDRTATAGGQTYHSRFTMYSTWQDAYYIQSIMQGYYYQLSPRSIIEQDSVGPEPILIHFLRDVRDGKVCAVKDKQMSDCSFFQTGLGERKFKTYGIDGYILIAEVTQIIYAHNKESLRTFNDEEMKQTENMLTDASPIPLVDARKSQFEYMI